MARTSRKSSKAERSAPVFRENRWASYARLSVKSNKVGIDDSIIHQLQRNRDFIDVYKRQIQNWILERNPTRTDIPSIPWIVMAFREQMDRERIQI